MARVIKLGGREVGDGQPTYLVAEIGINHNGDLTLAKRLIEAARHAGVNAVKFQKRTPELCVPPEQQGIMRDTPWGYISYLDYRRKVEFGQDEYRAIDAYCRELGIGWFASVWDEPSIEFLEPFNTLAIKIPSAALTDSTLLRRARAAGKPVILSTGMSTQAEIKTAVGVLGMDDLLITHATSTYPCPPDELNLRMIQTLMRAYPCPVGYSGHEVGLIPTVVAVALGACLVERHITLDRAMWGTDQAASVEPSGFERLVKYIRVTEAGLGDGIKRVYPSEEPAKRKLRRVFN
jgi:N-acetylneuraminate synthase